MSIFSPCSSVITARTRWPIGPMQAPLALTPGTSDVDRDLGAVAGLAGQRRDLDRAVGDLGDLEREQLAHQVRVGAGQADLRTLAARADARPRSSAGARRGRTSPPAPARPAAGRPRPCRGPPARSAGRCLLDHAGDEVALAAAEVAKDLLVLEVTQALHDDLAGGRGRDAAEARRGVVELGPGSRALALRGGRAPRGPRRRRGRSCGRARRGPAGGRPRCGGTPRAAPARSRG